MKKIILLCMLPCIYLTSCSSDATVQNGFAGNYEVTFSLGEEGKKELLKAKDEIAKAKDDIKINVESSKEEIAKGIAEAKESISKEMADNPEIEKAIGDLVEGAGKIAEGAGKIGEATGSLLPDFVDKFMKNIKFNIGFEKDGNLKFDANQLLGINFDINSKDAKWAIKDGKMHITGTDKNDLVLEMKDLGSGKWQLTNKDISLNLVKLDH